MPYSAALVQRRSTVLDLPQLMAMLSLPSVAEGYFGTAGSLTLAKDTLTRNLAETDDGRAEVWVGCAVHQPMTLLAYAAVVDGRLAYLVHPGWQGKGLATAIARWACDKAFDARPGLGIGALVFRENVASVRVLEHLGFRFTGLCWPAVLGCHQPRAMLCFELDAGGTGKTRPLRSSQGDVLQHGAVHATGNRTGVGRDLGQACAGTSFGAAKASARREIATCNEPAATDGEENSPGTRVRDL